MEDRLVDPYEQQLLSVFDSCDDERIGSLDKHGLSLLCEKLQLEEQGTNLIECLLDNAADRATFTEFRDGLLHILGQGQGSNQAHGIDETGELPEREVSPKFVFGKKKYGRRSRPKHDQSSPDANDNSDSETSSLTNHYVEGGAKSVMDKIQVKKRRTSTGTNPDRLTMTDSACTIPIDEVSLQNAQVVHSLPSKGANGDNEIECLRKAWERLGVGSDGFLDRTELALVCDHIGMEKVAEEVVKEVFDTLDVDRDNRISFEEFLLLFRGSSNSKHLRTNSSPDTKALHFDGRMNSSAGDHQALNCATDYNTYFWSLDLNGNGFVSAELILEVWENACVADGATLLHNLGFNEPQVKVAELVNILDNELHSIQVENNGIVACTTTETLLQATLALYQTEIRCLKSSIEQVYGERDKLRCDITEANERASLLAQEVDDHHLRLEISHQLKFKSLEQRHSDNIKLLTEQLALERDHLTHQNQALESRVWELEEIESQTRSELSAVKDETVALYKENQSLVEQLAKIEVEYVSAQRELEALDSLRHGLSELELNSDNEKVHSLLEKLDDIRAENTDLRDRNDELTMQLEALTSELAAVSFKKSGHQCCEPVQNIRLIEQDCVEPFVSTVTDDLIIPGGAIKRRGDPPQTIMSPCEESSEEENSPRLEKVRRCCSTPEAVDMIGLQVCTLTHTGSAVNLLNVNNIEKVDSSFKNSLSITNKQSPTTENTLQVQVEQLNKQVEVLKEKLWVCEEENKHHLKENLKRSELYSSLQLDNQTSQRAEEIENISSTKESTNLENTKEQLEQHCRDLKSQLDQVKIEIVKILSERNACSKENCALKTHISDLKTSLGQPESEHSSALSNSSEVVAFQCPEKLILDFQLGLSEKCLNFNNSNKSSIETSDIEPSEDESEYKRLLQQEFAEKLSIVEENHTKEKIELFERCTNLESSIEMLRQEYEKCEDYWASKLEEERVIFDKEQRVLDKNYKKILAELKEYDEYFNEERTCNCHRLDTIQESEKLESQVTVLEEECEELRRQVALERSERSRESQLHMDQLTEFQSRCAVLQESQLIETSDIACQQTFNSLEEPPMETIQVYLKKCTNEVGIQVSESENCSRQPPSDISDLLIRHSQLLAEIASLECQKEHIQTQQEEKNEKYSGGMSCGKQACRVDLNILQTMNTRWRQQEQRCRHLQLALKQRQHHTDALLQHTWSQHKREMAEMESVLGVTQNNLKQQSLAYKEQMDHIMRNDILVKDLYVENAYLISTVQRLEHRCQVLAQMTTDSISV